jgi:glycosyltransferase involved in cell wall biosynthesis
MRIVFLTQYFPPETGAPQNRLYDLARRLQDMGEEIVILTTMPNYPEMIVHEKYRGKWFCRETIDGLDIIRSWLFARKTGSGLIVRLLTYFSFVISSLITGLVSLRRFDIIFCESPPLFLGISAYLLKVMKGGKLVFNVSDLWPESAEELGLVTNRFALSAARQLEVFLYKHSALISCQTMGIVRNISGRLPDKTVFWLKNGVDLSFFNPETVTNDWRTECQFSRNDYILLYAGIIGHAQGLEVILKAAECLREKQEIRFAIVGSGPEKTRLIKMKDRLHLDNVRFFDPVPRERMPDIISTCDAGIIPLKKLDLFKGAIPSKSFEFLALEKPILLGVEGEADELLVTGGRSGLLFEPENHEDLARQIMKLYESKELSQALGKNGLALVTRYFDRRRIAKEFHEMLKSI